MPRAASAVSKTSHNSALSAGHEFCDYFEKFDAGGVPRFVRPGAGVPKFFEIVSKSLTCEKGWIMRRF